MCGSILYAIPPGCCQFQGKYSIQVTCDDVMVLLHIFIHIGGVHITTKINFLSECDSICFLIMRSDIVGPRLLTYEPSEHKNNMLRGLRRGFTVRAFLNVVNKLHRIWKIMVEVNMKP